jgi:phosphate transport system permease protein
VLGFLAGLVFAQFVENALPMVLACTLTLPLAFLLGAQVWQLLPDKVSLLLAKWRFAFICVTLPLGLAAALPVGSLLERTLFGGDLRGWIDNEIDPETQRRRGGAIGGWVLLLLPICCAVTAYVMVQFVNPWIRSRSAVLSKSGAALIELTKFIVGFATVVLLALAFGWFLQEIRLDPRDSFANGPYSQRNALIVGFAMGFAIIPIIYTIAEDALSAVPEHLRAGSLAAGATRWQTAVRIVIPTAMSGLFSAIMIGLGRAVGETMIVLMATGNTPVMNLSMFTGFRALSANIAVELPESVQNSTHYRTLFLAALTLFAMTFVLNTLAEFVRLRFRKRAYQL